MGVQMPEDRIATYLYTLGETMEHIADVLERIAQALGAPDEKVWRHRAEAEWQRAALRARGK